MRALIKTAPGVGHLEMLETAPTRAGPGEALVRVGPSGLCGTDLLLFDGVYRGRNRPVPSPLIVGHEASGEVDRPGTRHGRPAPGTRVGIEAGDGMRCLLSLPARELQPVPGPAPHRADASRCRWRSSSWCRRTSLLPLPDEVTLESAAFLEPLATAVHTMERVKPAPGHERRDYRSGATRIPAPAGAAGRRRRSDRDAAARRAMSRDSELAAFAGRRSCFSAIDRRSRQHARGRRPAESGSACRSNPGGTSAAIQTALDIVAGNGTLVEPGNRSTDRASTCCR